MGALDAPLAHDSGDPLAVHALSQTPQFGMDARDAVGLVGGDVDDGDLVGQRLVGGLPGRSGFRRGEPGVERGAGHLQESAQEGDIMGGLHSCAVGRQVP